MNKIEEVLEKYLEGQTSLEEEKMLREYFLQEEIPESLVVYRSIFGFFSKEIGERKSVQTTPLILKKKNNYKSLVRWFSIGVAASLLLFLGIKNLYFRQEEIHPKSMVYINGKAFADIGTINKEALNSLENISDQNSDIISSQIDLLDSFSKD